MTGPNPSLTPGGELRVQNLARLLGLTISTCTRVLPTREQRITGQCGPKNHFHAKSFVRGQRLRNRHHRATADLVAATAVHEIVVAAAAERRLQHFRILNLNFLFSEHSFVLTLNFFFIYLRHSVLWKIKNYRELKMLLKNRSWLLLILFPCHFKTLI